MIGSLLTNHGFYFAVMRRTPAAGILEYIIPLLYLPVFTIWVSAIKQASHTHKLFTVWVSATKQASHTHKLSTVWVSATKQASHTHELFSVWVSAIKQASHTHELSTAWVSATKQASHTHKLSIAWVSATKQASHTHKLFTLRRKKGTEELDPMHSIHKCVAKGTPHLLAALRNELCFRKLSIYSSSFSIWLTLAGSALPFIAFMV